METATLQPPTRERTTRVVTAMESSRRELGLTLREAARRAQCDVGTLSRLERGIHKPSQQLARRLFYLYQGRVPLGSIYDPLFRPESSRLRT